MTGAWRSRRVAVALGLATTLLAAGAAAFWPVDVRHSAPFGFSQTFDRRRSIAVRGGYVTANYDDFHRVDLDLRAYDVGEHYDLTVHVRPAAADAPELREVSLSVAAEEIWHQKAPFANPFVTVRFDPIAQAAGQRFYVWVEAGPRNRDSVWTLWSVKSYSRVPAHAVLRALVESPPDPLAGVGGRVVLILLLGGTIGAAGWLVVALSIGRIGRFNGKTAGAPARPVAAVEG